MIRTDDLSLYEYESCPFCARVRDALAQLEMSVESRDIHTDPGHLSDLVAATGRQTVPCIRIRGAGADGGDRWMHESLEIIDYLEKRASAQ